MPILMDYNQALIAAAAKCTSELAKVKMTPTENDIRSFFLNGLQQKCKAYGKKYGQLVICADSSVPSWRKEVFPYYKYKRNTNRVESPLDFDLIFKVMAVIEEELRTDFPYKVIKVDRAEGDDVIAALVKYHAENELECTGLLDEPQHIMILSSDHDFKQLQIFDNVDQYSPTQHKPVRESSPVAYLKHHIIKGDKGDGIPNIFSDDDTFASDTKRQKTIRSDKLEAIMEAKTIEDYSDDQEVKRNWDRNNRLVNLIECIPPELEEEIVLVYINYKTVPRARLLNYFIKHRLNNLMPEIQNF